MSYRTDFLGATDKTAYTAIRSTVEGTSEYINAMGGESLDFANKMGGVDNISTYDPMA